MSFRDRLRPDIAELSALRLFDYGSTRTDLVRLDCNEAPFGVDADVMDEFRAELDRLSLNRYPDVSGEPLRRALAARWGVETEEILLGNGSIELLALLMTAFGGVRTGRPAKVLYPDPSFPHYEVIARTSGLVPIPVPLEADFRLDEGKVTAAIAEHDPALILIASPNNPTGNAFDPDALERLARRSDAVFVVDEAYADFAGGGGAPATLIPRARRTPGLLVTRTFSKIGYAGMRLGALLGAREVVSELDKVRLPWNVNAFTLAFAQVLLRHPERMEARARHVIELRADLRARLQAVPGVVVFPSEANFVLVRIPLPTAAVFARMCALGVLVKNVSRPGLLERCLRITVGTAVENARCASVLATALR